MPLPDIEYLKFPHASIVSFDRITYPYPALVQCVPAFFTPPSDIAHSLSVCKFASSGDIFSGPLPLSYLHGFSFSASVSTCTSLFSSNTITSSLRGSICFHHSSIHSVESSTLYISSTGFSRVVERGKACVSGIVRRSAISGFFQFGRPL